MKITLQITILDLIEIIAALDAAERDMRRPRECLSAYAENVADNYGRIRAQLDMAYLEAKPRPEMPRARLTHES